MRGIDAIMDEYDQTTANDASSPTTISNSNESNNNNNTIIFVDTSTKMKECALTLLRSIHNHTLTELAFDLEAHNPSKYQQSTCLIQLCTNTGYEYMIDVLANDTDIGYSCDDDTRSSCVWDHVSLLRPIFAHPHVVKIGHGITGIDVPCLHKDFGIFIVNGFDTFEAANVLCLKGHLGLAKLCEYYKLVDNDCKEGKTYSKLKEKYQNADWRVRPLEKEMIDYGLRDVRYLVKLRQLLMNDLTGGGDGEVVANTPLMHDDAFLMTLGSCRTNDTDVSGIGSSSSGEKEEEENAEKKHAVQVKSDNGTNDDGYFTPEDESDNSGKLSVPHVLSAASSSVFALDKHENLTKVLKRSQERCLGFWTVKTEPIGKNDTLIKLIKRADILTCGNTSSTSKQIWTQSDMTLYSELTEWRFEVAKKEGIMPAMVCSLDLLVLMAYKRPGCRIGLKRLSYYIPELLQDGNEPDYLDDAFSIIFLSNESRTSKGHESISGVVEEDVKFYADRTVVVVKEEAGREDRDNNDGIYQEKSYMLGSWSCFKKSSLLSTMKWTTLGAVVVTFWIRVANKTKR